MKIHLGKHLEISYNEKASTFFQKWINTQNLDLNLFKSEMLIYTEKYELYKPKHTIWDQTNFTLELTPNDYLWIENHVNIPCKKFGNEKCAFVVGKDVLAHISVMNSFDNVQSCIIPKHFSSIDEALEWTEKPSLIEPSELKIQFEGVNDTGENVFKISTESQDIKSVLKNLKNLIEDQEFFRANKQKFLSLTKREKEILRLLGEEQTIKEIAIDNEVSILTIRTHYRNIKRKLTINSLTEIYRYYRVFIK